MATSHSNLALLHALDTATIRPSSLTTHAIAALAFFTASYNLFCISSVSRLLGRLYYYHPKTGQPGELPTDINNLVVVVALVGTLTGQLFFGWLGDKLGRKIVFRVSMIIMVICSICSAIEFGSRPATSAVVGTLCFFRFWLGFGIGGVYPLAATIASESADKRNRGKLMSGVFAMQGLGTVCAGLVPMFLSEFFLGIHGNKEFKKGPPLSTQPHADLVWRITLMLGALPAMITFFWSMTMPETGRHTALVKGIARKAARDMGIVDIQIENEQKKLFQFQYHNNYPLLSNQFFDLHGIHLIGTMSTWFLLDIAFYSQYLTQKAIFPEIGLELASEDAQINPLQEVHRTSRALFLVAFFGTFPGYWFTVIFIDRLGRFTIQLVGFFIMSAFMLGMGYNYEYLKVHNKKFAILYSITFFFSNFGANSTTFLLPAELFPTRMRCRCHALSAAAGKAGAIIGAFVVQSYTADGKPSKIKHALMVLGFTNMLGFCCTFLVTETKGRSLEEISGEDGGQN